MLFQFSIIKLLSSFWSKTEFATCVSSCCSNTFECYGVVYFCDNVFYLAIAAIGSFRVWIAWMVDGITESILDLVRLAIARYHTLSQKYNTP